MLKKLFFLLLLLNQFNTFPIPHIHIFNDCDRETDIQLFEKKWCKDIQINDDLIILNQNERYVYEELENAKDITVTFMVEGAQNKNYVVPKNSNYAFIIRNNGIYLFDIDVEMMMGVGILDDYVGELIYAFE